MKQELYIGGKTFSSLVRHGHKRIKGCGMAHSLALQYKMCEQEGKRIVVVDPKSDLKLY